MYFFFFSGEGDRGWRKGGWVLCRKRECVTEREEGERWGGGGEEERRLDGEIIIKKKKR